MAKIYETFFTFTIIFLTVATKEMDLVFVKMVGNQIIAVYQLKLVCLTIFCLKKKKFLLDKGQCE